MRILVLTLMMSFLSHSAFGARAAEILTLEGEEETKEVLQTPPRPPLTRQFTPTRRLTISTDDERIHTPLTKQDILNLIEHHNHNYEYKIDVSKENIDANIKETLRKLSEDESTSIDLINIYKVINPHWTCVYFHKSASFKEGRLQIVILDSLAFDSEYSRKLLYQISESLKEYHLDIDIYASNWRRQTDGFSCGLFSFNDAKNISLLLYEHNKAKKELEYGIEQFRAYDPLTQWYDLSENIRDLVIYTSERIKHPIHKLTNYAERSMVYYGIDHEHFYKLPRLPEYFNRQAQRSVDSLESPYWVGKNSDGRLRNFYIHDMWDIVERILKKKTQNRLKSVLDELKSKNRLKEQLKEHIKRLSRQIKSCKKGKTGRNKKSTLRILLRWYQEEFKRS
jgi:hypothetical protein